MNEIDRLIIDKAKEFGADLAGIACLDQLKRSPSHAVAERMPEFDGVGTRDTENHKRSVVRWPEEARSALVIAVEHPVEKPEMDWWTSLEDSKGTTEGNRQLIRIISGLAPWIEESLHIRCFKLPYHIENGGAYMKDAAVLAGLGCIGKSNLLITPRYGPQVRLRVMLMNAELPSTGPLTFDPCEECSEPCRSACPRNAFAKQVYSEQDYALKQLPGRDGTYDRLSCDLQMRMEAAEAENTKNESGENSKYRIKYCRKCEIVCPAGSRKSEF